MTVSYAYQDARRLLTGVTRGTETVGYGRTESGELEHVQYPAGQVDYGYDALDRLRTVTVGGRTTTLSWEAGGQRLLDAEDLTQLHECRRYDGRGRVTLVANVPAGDMYSAATAMLENGADIRFIQEMLGHAKLTSTQVYTRVSITKLKAVHTATHPAALLEGRGQAAKPEPEEDK